MHGFQMYPYAFLFAVFLGAVSALPVTNTKASCTAAGYYWWAPDNWCDTSKNIDGITFSSAQESCTAAGHYWWAPDNWCDTSKNVDGIVFQSNNLPNALTLAQLAAKNTVLQQWVSLIESACAAYPPVPLNLVGGVILQESGGDPNAYNSNDQPPSVGLMQINDGPYDPTSNVFDGVHMLQQAWNQYGDWSLVLRDYNSGDPYAVGTGTASYVTDILDGWLAE
jgi:hypothetical protein